MKNVINKLLLVSMVSCLFQACKKNETLTVLKLGAPSALTASPTTLVLTKATENNIATTFTFTAADFGYKAAVGYTLQFCKPGNNFVTISQIQFPNNISPQDVSVRSMNIAALNAGLDTVSSQPIQVRLKADIGNGQTPLYSNVISMNIKPYSLNAFLWVPGDYQGWDPGSAPRLISINSTGIFEGYVNIPGGTLQFKINSDPDWNHTNYGWVSTDPNVNNSGTMSGSGGNLFVVAPGYYLLKANLNNLKWGPFVKTTWSIIGDLTSWSSDIPLTYNTVTQKWTASVNPGSSGAFKFRANNDWTYNFGDNGANGSLEYDGSNISLSAGPHTITFDLHTPGNYTYTIQ